MVLGDKGLDLGRNDFAPAAAIENAVMSSAGGKEMLFLGFGQLGRQSMRCFGLANAGNIVPFAFNGHQGAFGDF